MHFRPALPTDIAAIAAMHADSWRRYYRAAYADSYLDGDILPDRLNVWTTRLRQPDPGSITIVADPEPDPATVTVTADPGPGVVAGRGELDLGAAAVRAGGGPRVAGRGEFDLGAAAVEAGGGPGVVAGRGELDLGVAAVGADLGPAVAVVAEADAGAATIAADADAGAGTVGADADPRVMPDGADPGPGALAVNADADPGVVTVGADPGPGAVAVVGGAGPEAAATATGLAPGSADMVADPAPRSVAIVAEPGDPASHHPVVVGTGGQSGTRHNPLLVIAGFVHVVLDHDERWGSLLDNLHVTSTRHRGGLGSELLVRAARATVAQARTTALYLWVQEQNTAAQAFYAAHGGKVVERAPISDPGGVPGRLKGRPMKLRVTWPDARTIIRRP